MKHGAKYFDFFYDANGTAAGFAYRQNASSAPTYYYYEVNTRGDVEVIYNSSGLVLAKYKYDAYGKLLNVTNSADVTLYDPDSIAHLNPLRYRSYVYDTESGLYYLQARYYDPTTCRFINSDPAYISTGQGINGNNMFAYCNNNPVMYSDPTGTKIFECCPYGNCDSCRAKKKAKSVNNTSPESNNETEKGFTYSNGLGLSINIGFISFTGQAGISTDAKGNVGIQFTGAYSINASSSGGDLGASVGSYNTFTNAGDIYKLEKEGYQIGAGASATIPNTNMNGFSESNVVIIPTNNPNKCYLGYSDFKGISTYSDPDFNLHYSRGYTSQTLCDFNIFDLFGG